MHSFQILMVYLYHVGQLSESLRLVSHIDKCIFLQSLYMCVSRFYLA